MSNKVYDVLKFIAQILLPAIATLYTSVAKIWGFPLGTEIGATIMAIDAFMGAILMISSSSYNKQQKLDG